LGAISDDCASGAIGGAVSEIGAELTGNAGLGQYSALGVALLSGTDAEGIYTANNTALNSLDNNYLAPHEKAKLIDLEEKKDSCEGKRCTEIESEIKELRALDKSRNKEFDGYLEGCNAGDINACRSAKYIHYDLRMKWTLDGNEYYLKNKGEFKPMLESERIFHNFPRDPITGAILDGENKNTKWIHPKLGYEVVLDDNKNIVTDALNAGTYNFYNPGFFGDDALIGTHSHMKYDVDPYFEYGNAPYPIDPTTKEQRNNRKDKYIPALGRDIGNTTKKATGTVIQGIGNIFREEQTN